MSFGKEASAPSRGYRQGETATKGPGLKPPTNGLFKREVIGPTECPLLHRWTLLNTRWGKLLVHRFLPNADDRAEHDHPASFVTMVLAGSYTDLSPAGADCLRRGSVRLRRAEHRHKTRVGPHGCLTLVVMGPKRRSWGFWKEGRWWPWREHELRFGFGMRCPGAEPSGGAPNEKQVPRDVAQAESPE